MPSFLGGPYLGMAQLSIHNSITCSRQLRVSKPVSGWQQEGYKIQWCGPRILPGTLRVVILLIKVSTGHLLWVSHRVTAQRGASNKADTGRVSPWSKAEDGQSDRQQSHGLVSTVMGEKGCCPSCRLGGSLPEKVRAQLWRGN